MRLPAAGAILLTLFVGSTWTIGYLVAPTLFSTIADRALAGSIAGSLFRIEALVSLVSGVLLLMLLHWRTDHADKDGAWFRKPQVLVGLIIGCTLAGYYGLQPIMAALRTSGDVMTADARLRFGILHGISSAIYLVKSLLGLLLVTRLR